MKMKQRLARFCTLGTKIVYFTINLRINGTKISSKINQICIEQKLMIYFVILQPSKILVDNIKIIKAESEKEYIEDSKLLLDDIKNEFIRSMNGETKNSWLSNLNTYVIKDFKWNSKIAIQTYLKSLINNSTAMNKTLFIDSEMYTSRLKQDSILLITEAAFGSFWIEMEDMNNCFNTPSTVINKINYRRQSAIKIINSQNFNKKRNLKYCSKIFDIFAEEMTKVSVNHNNEKVAGWQKLWTCNKNDVQDRPFEAIKQLSSTRERLILSQNWKRIIRHPNF